MRRLHLLLALCLAGGLVAACSDNSDNGGSDGGGSDPGTSLPDAALTAWVKDLKLPTEAGQYGIDYMNTGTKLNALGKIVSVMSSVFSLQTEVTQEITNNELVVLFQIHADSLTTDDSMDIQVWRGKKEGNIYKASAASPTDAKLAGQLTDGQLAAGPGDFKFPIPTGGTPIFTTLKKAQVKGVVNAGGITGGEVAGAIPWTDVEGTLIPGIAATANQMYQGDDQEIKDALKTFDTNPSDGTITAAEISGHALLKAILKADVDLDGDQTMDALSVGMAFTADTVPTK